MDHSNGMVTSTSTPNFVAIVLAAGLDEAMQCPRPLALYPLAGRAMICYPVQAAIDAGASAVWVVAGHEQQRVQATLKERFDTRVRVVVQAEQGGTGDAADCAMRALEPETPWVVVLHGNLPLVSPEAVRCVAEVASQGPSQLALLTCDHPDPNWYGRVLRDDEGRIAGIREPKHGSHEREAMGEVSPGVYAMAPAFFASGMAEHRADNAQGEFYLTDLVGLAARAGGVQARGWNATDLGGARDRYELAERERCLRLRVAQKHARAGVTIRDPATTYIDADVRLETDVVVEPMVSLRGQTVVQQGARVDVGCVLENVHVGRLAHIRPYTVATDSTIGSEAKIGPFSHLRPQSQIGPDAHVGNFVETKKTVLGEGSKANHLAYLGDGVIGRGVNVGAGTIFCNYDGYNKHTTTLADGCFVGSDSQLVAPVTVGKNAFVASGTTVTENVPEDALAIGRARQQNKLEMGTKLRQRLAAQKRARDNR